MSSNQGAIDAKEKMMDAEAFYQDLVEELEADIKEGFISLVQCADVDDIYDGCPDGLEDAKADIIARLSNEIKTLLEGL